nr:polysaccharide deacetylase family protein [uncultured Capnocytophaga sp.]
MNKHLFTIAIFVTALITAFIQNAPWWGYVLLIVLFLGITSWGVFDIRLSYFVKTQYFLKGRPVKTVALTFDDGPSELTPQFLDLLQKYNAKAVFFCIGKQIQKYPEVIKRMQAEGHLVANHTFTHQPKNILHAKVLADEIRNTDEALARLDIVTPFFRPPYGITSPPVARAIKATAKKVIGWDVRSLDTVIHNEDKLFQRIVRKLSNGNIILMHDRLPHTLNVLERLLQYLKENNYTITNDLE